MRFLIEFIVPVVLALGFLYGIRLMQSPRTAVRGNRIGALCMAIAVLLTMWRYGLLLLPEVWAALAVGAGIGFFLALRAKTIQMPQLVALFNGLGGAASALVIAAVIGLLAGDTARYAWLVAALALGIGSLTFSGSMVAALKLQGRIPSKPLVSKSAGFWTKVLLGHGIGLIVVVGFVQRPILLYLVIVLFLAYGILMALRVGGADMPVIISFLNALSGVAACVSGFALGNMLAAGVGALVGVAGMILTQLMCRAMNRNLMQVLSGFSTPVPKRDGPGREAPRPSVYAETGDVDAPEAGFDERQIPALLQAARKIIIVPGYGMALAQAQDAVKDLMDALEGAGKEVKVAVHPVAGRMPGHMHVLLAEAGVDYDSLYDMAKINHEFAETDVVIAVGACDVMNPAAATAEGTPIHGMPILNVSEAKAVIVCNLDEKPGYSGVDNTLYGAPRVITLWGDAAETVPAVTRALLDEEKGAAT